MTDAEYLKQFAAAMRDAADRIERGEIREWSVQADYESREDDSNGYSIRRVPTGWQRVTITFRAPTTLSVPTVPSPPASLPKPPEGDPSGPANE